MGLKPLLLHVDAGWNTEVAVSNIEKVVDGLSADLYTEVIDWRSVQKMQTAFYDLEYLTKIWSKTQHFLVHCINLLKGIE